MTENEPIADSSDSLKPAEATARLVSVLADHGIRLHVEAQKDVTATMKLLLAAAQRRGWDKGRNYGIREGVTQNIHRTAARIHNTQAWHYCR